MKLYLDNLPLGDVPGPRRQPGEFFPRLVGVRVSSARNSRLDWIDVEPLYIPLVRIRAQAGQVLVEINSTRPLVYITLQRRKPFIHIFRFQWKILDTDF